MTIEERAKALEASVSSLTAERDDLRKTIEASAVGASAELETLKVDASAKDARIAELTEALAVATAKVGELEASAESATAKAAKILAGSAVEPVAAAIPGSVANGLGSIAEQYAAMPAGPERRAFLKKHKSALFGSK
jgi:hypothetical protein